MADVNRSTAAVPYGRGDDEGEAVWFLGQLFVIKASTEETAGAFALCENFAPRGPAAPLHVQPNEDETFYVLEGDLTVYVDGEEITASAAPPCTSRGGLRTLSVWTRRPRGCSC